MSDEENKAVVRRFWEKVFNQGELSEADEIFTSDHVVHITYLSQDERGPDIMKHIVAVPRKISPDMRVTVEDEIAEGDKVVTSWKARGTLANELRDVNSDDDNEVEASGVTIYRVNDGKIEETW